jgi:hypothetical protein
VIKNPNIVQYLWVLSFQRSVIGQCQSHYHYHRKNVGQDFISVTWIMLFSFYVLLQKKCMELTYYGEVTPVSHLEINELLLMKFWYCEFAHMLSDFIYFEIVLIQHNPQLHWFSWKWDRMDLGKMSLEDGKCMQLAQDHVQWCASVWEMLISQVMLWENLHISYF